MPVLVNVAIIHVSEAKTACSVQVLTDTAKFKSILQFKQPMPANASGKLADCTTAAMQRNFQRGPHQRLTCRHLCCLQHTPTTFDFLQLCVVPELSQPHGENPKLPAKFLEAKPLFLSTMVAFLQHTIVTQMKNKFFFLAARLPGDVLCSAGSAVKVSRGAGSRTFDVPDLRSRRQAYVLALCIKQL